jgi:hypothetical protein
MLQLRVRFLLESKGIPNPFNYLIKMGFTPNVATRVLNGKIERIGISQVNRLCTALVCTPNELFAWKPAKDESLSAQHPLLGLIRNDTPFNIIGKIEHLSMDQLKEVEQFISKIKTAPDQNP